MLARANELQDQLIAWRRDFHMHPELGFQETRTAARVAETLEQTGFRVRTGVGRTGVVAERGAGSPVVALRADMDALPIQEANETPYVSQTPGVMHACDHDAHTAILLGVGTLLAEEELPGTVRLLFQPAEEAADAEGGSGAPRMIADGAMTGVDDVMALHVNAQAPFGKVEVSAGATMAGVDSFYATIYGQGGHGAYPHTTVDPIFIAAHVLTALHGIVSRRIAPTAPAVITIGSVHAGTAPNIIPGEVALAGTIRYLDPAVRETIHTEIENTLVMARNLGGDYRVEIKPSYPSTINEKKMVALSCETAIDLIGAECVGPLERVLEVILHFHRYTAG